jgi:hypothetical protein
MSSTVRNLERYVIVRHEGGLVEDVVIFVEDQSSVTIHTAWGETYCGDLLALETYAKLHDGIAYPVEKPPGFNNVKQEVLLPEIDHSDLPGNTSFDWSEDQEEEEQQGGGVTLQSAEEEKPIVTGGPLPVSGGPVKVHLDTTGATEEGKPPPAPDLHLLPFTQGRGRTGVGPWDGGSNPYHDRPGSGIGNVMISLEGTDIPPDQYGTAFRKRGAPSLPMFTDRDLSNCMYGMPRHAGTTIAGTLRPDTGGRDPVLPDHMMWMEYARRLGTVKCSDGDVGTKRP